MILKFFDGTFLKESESSKNDDRNRAMVWLPLQDMFILKKIQFGALLKPPTFITVFKDNGFLPRFSQVAI